MAYYVLVGSAFSWSFLYILARLLKDVNYINVSLFRFVFGFLCFLPIYFFFKKREKIKFFSKDFYLIIGIVLVNGIASTAMALAAKYANASVNAIFFTLNPLFVALFAPYITREKNKIINYIGVIIALCGIFLIITEGGKILNFWQIKTFYSLILGIIFDGFLIGISTNLVKNYINRYSPWTITLYSMIVNSIFLSLVALFYGNISEMTNYSSTHWLYLLLIGLFPTAIAFSTFYLGIKIIGASKASFFKLLTPVFSVILAIILLKEPFFWYIIIGGIITISGLYLTQKK